MPMDDPRKLLDDTPMRALQWGAVALCVLLNALDGFDVLAISFAAPGIAAEWGIDRAALGLVLSMELIGMAAGSVLLGQVADRVGRRPTILGCLMVMTIGMALVPLAGDVVMLSGIRLFTGIGIGGMLACTNAMVAEYANARNRGLTVAIMAAGYPLGVVIGGSAASALLAAGGWRDVFMLGTVAAAILVPLAWWGLPEPIGSLIDRGGPRALARTNATLVRMGHAPISTLPPPTAKAARLPIAALFRPELAATTVLLTVAYFAHIMTFYFMLKWIPKIVVDLGYAPASAGGVLVWANIGGLLGAVVLGLASRRLGPRRPMVVALAGSAAMVAWFGHGHRDIDGLRSVAAIAGFFTNAGVVGLYALIAQAFPTALRGTGTGLVIGVGRGGAALGPIIAGALFAGGGSLGVVAIGMAMGSVVALVALLVLPQRQPAGRL